LIGVAAIATALIFLARSPVATVSAGGGVSEYLTGQLIEVPGEPIQPLPSKLDLDPRKVAFGKDLFSDRRLSRDGTVACASCHRPDHGGADDVALSKGLGERLSEVNTPTFHNAGAAVAQFWDGRVVTLEEQVESPLHNPNEMGTNWTDAIARLESDPVYAATARDLYGAPLSPAIVKAAIADYERSSVTNDSRFDAFLRGRTDALSAAEVAGYRLFKEYGCTACHQGAAVGGNMFQKFGLFRDYFADRSGPLMKADLGRYNVTGREEDKYVFKVPSLREAALTAPYFHDGSAATLENAVAVMARYQLGRTIPDKDIDLIVAFLRTLTAVEQHE
jgi:cytochrome c peroxidase